MKHGGDLLSYQHLYDGELIDFSSNINPLGYPAILDEVIPQNFSCLAAYPDIQYRKLRQAIAVYLGCQAEEVLVGNGSMDILDHFCQRAGRVLICIPCFSEYRERAVQYNIPVVPLELGRTFQVTASLLEREIRPHDVVILGNPNNPTGLRIEQRELLAIHQMTEEHDAFLVLDEAFFEFCLEDYDSIRLLYSKPNVCIIRAATKFFGLPGLRLGYAYATSNIADKYARAALPWRINALADLAGQHIFQQSGYISQSKACVTEQRTWMLSQLQEIPEIHVYPTDADFILIRLHNCTEDDIFKRLACRGLLIRKASSFEGLDNRYIRVAIKDHTKNKTLIDALRQELPKLSRR